jgi:hypothetical protein
VMFFAPFVNNMINSDFFSDYEKSFLRWYIKVWYINLAFLIIVLLATWLNFFWINPAISRIIIIWSIIIYTISVLTIFACANDVSMWMDGESIKQNIQHKWQLIKTYTPIMNFILRFRQENYNMPYRRLKESVLLRTFFIFGTLLFWSSFWIWVLVFIAIRLILLLLNVDIIPLGVKKSINSIFSCNPWEVFAYIFAPAVLKIKKLDYEAVLQSKKQWYEQWQNFWIWIVVQYILFLGILFLLHRWIDFSVNHIILLIAMLLWIFRVMIFFIHKKALLKIPILSEIVSLIFH